MSIPTAKCIRHSARVVQKFRTQATCHRSDAGKGAKWVSSPRSQVGVLTQEPRSGCPHPRAERVSSLRSRESVLTQPMDFLRVLTRVRVPPVDQLSKSCQNNLAARAEVAVVLHQPLRDPGMTFPGRRTSEPCLFHAGRSHQHLDVEVPRVIVELAGWPLDL